MEVKPKCLTCEYTRKHACGDIFCKFGVCFKDWLAPQPVKVGYYTYTPPKKKAPP